LIFILTVRDHGRSALTSSLLQTAITGKRERPVQSSLVILYIFIYAPAHL